MPTYLSLRYFFINYDVITLPIIKFLKNKNKKLIISSSKIGKCGSV